MAEVFTFRLVRDEVTPTMKRLDKKLKPALAEAARKTCGYAKTQLKRSLTTKGLRWKHRLWKSIKVRPRSGSRYVVDMLAYGIMLDSQRPHFVTLKRGRKITQWARGNPPSNSPWSGMKPSQLPRAIRVKPHHWIDRPLEMAAAKATEYMNQEVSKVIKG